MNSIMAVVSQLVQHVVTVVPEWFNLFVYTEEDVVDGVATSYTAVTPLALFCIGIPLVGLGIGIIRRLVKIRA